MTRDTHYPLVSVAITSYNYAQFVGGAVRSALAQDYPKIEVLVGDDASSDDSVAVVEEIAKRDSRVRLFVNELNVGAVANCNSLLELCTGDYVTMLCADNYMLPGHISSAVEYHQRHPECGVRSTGWLEIFDETDRPSGVRRLPSWANIARYSERSKLEDIFCFGDETLIETILFPRSVFERFGYFEDSAVNDVEFLMRLADAGIKFAYDSTPYVAFRYHGSGRGTPSNYVATGRQLRGWAGLHERYLTESVAMRLAGRRRRVAHTFAMFAKALERDNPTLCAELRGDPNGPIAAAERRIAAVPDKAANDAVTGPPISVIVPTVGRVEMLLASLDSIAAQSSGGIEIVVVQNDGNDLEPLLRSLPYGEKIVYARTLSTGNAAAARNVGIRLALGETIAYLDEGDRWAPDHVAAIRAALSDGTVDVVQTGARAIFYDISPTEPSRVDPPLVRAIVDERFFPPQGTPFIDAFGLYVALSTIAHRKYCVEVIDAFDEFLPLREDWEFCLRLFGSGRFGGVALPAISVEVAYRKWLFKHTLRERLHAFVPATQYVYAKHPAQNEAVALQRTQRLAEMARALSSLNPPQSMADFAAAMRAITGAGAIAAAAGSPAG